MEKNLKNSVISKTAVMVGVFQIVLVVQSEHRPKWDYNAWRKMKKLCYETVDSAGEVFPGKIGSSVVLQQINTLMYAGEGRIRMFPF